MLILSLDLKEKKAYVDPMVCCFEIGNMFFLCHDLWNVLHLFLIIWLTRQERAKKLQHKDPKIYINCDKLLENADG